MEICKPENEVGLRHLPAISKFGGRQVEALWALEWAWQQIFGSIGIDEANSFQLKFCI